MDNVIYEELSNNINNKQRKVQIKKNTIKISKEVFKSNKYLRKISFNEELQKLDEEAFKDCKELKTVYFPLNTKLISIPKSCFENCINLEYFSLASSINIINSKAFTNCKSIKTLTIPNTVKIIEKDSFEGWTENQEIVIYKDYGEFINCNAKITELFIDKNKSEESITNKKEGKRYFAVKCKCGHVSRRYYIPITFGIIANNKKEAATIARKKGRVKHNHKDAILNNYEISYVEYLRIKKENKEDPYLNVYSKHEQKEIYHLLRDRLVPEKRYKIVKKVNKNSKKYYDGKKLIRNPKKYYKTNIE